MSQPEALQDKEFHCFSLKYQIQSLMEAGARGLLMEIAARPVEEDSKPDQGCPNVQFRITDIILFLNGLSVTLNQDLHKPNTFLRWEYLCWRLF